MGSAEKRALNCIYALHIIMVMSSKGGQGCDTENARPWPQPWPENREDLYCYNYCFETGADENCCLCNSCTTWEGEESSLFIEDLSVTGRNIVISKSQYAEANVYKIHRSGSEMKEFPINLCKDITDTKFGDLIISISNISEYRSKIVQINFEYNELEELGDLSCLNKLDELNLQYNRISFLSNTSFENLSYLRTLNLEGNRITTIQPNTLSSANLHILNADLSNNQLSTVDVSNVILPFSFCDYNLNSNNLTEFVNDNKFVLDTDQTYGPGFLNFQDNSITHFPDWKTLTNIEDLSIIGKLWDFGFDFRGIPITCDCSLQPFLSLAQDVIESLWRDYFVVTCLLPEHLQGTSIPALNLSELVCPLDAESGCQSPQCTCVDEPNKDTLVIDCSNAIPSLTKFPSIPNSSYSTHVSLNLSGNDIKEIPDEPYLSKLSILDLSRNDIREINDTIAGKFENTYLDLRKNDNFHRLSQTFQYQNACSVNIEDIVIDCDCDSQWIAEWLKSKGCKGSTFYCYVPGNSIIPANSFNVDDLLCSTPNNLPKEISIGVGITIGLLILSGFIIFKFRLELLIIYLRIRSNRKGGNSTHPNFIYDVYITLDENNEDIVNWVEVNLLEYLSDHGYRVFIPYRDMPVGSVRANEAANAIKRSRCSLVILSDNHFHMSEDERYSTDYEWKYCWNNFKEDKCKKIVLVNFDHISAGNMKHEQVKAFLRVGYNINFRNHDRDIMEKIRTKIGEPQGIRYSRLDRPYSRATVSYVDLELSSMSH